MSLVKNRGAVKIDGCDVTVLLEVSLAAYRKPRWDIELILELRWESIRAALEVSNGRSLSRCAGSTGERLRTRPFAKNGGWDVLCKIISIRGDRKWQTLRLVGPAPLSSPEAEGLSFCAPEGEDSGPKIVFYRSVAAICPARDEGLGCESGARRRRQHGPHSRLRLPPHAQIRGLGHFR